MLLRQKTISLPISGRLVPLVANLVYALGIIPFSRVCLSFYKISKHIYLVKKIKWQNRFFNA